jgi:hypothetical protein
MQEEIRTAILKSFALGFIIGGGIMVFIYSGIVIPALGITN